MKRTVIICVLSVLVFMTCGCRRTLFPKDEPRTQFDAYNTMRYGPMITLRRDPFGVPEPALRERLIQRND